VCVERLTLWRIAPFPSTQAGPKPDSLPRIKAEHESPI
jgi:hypothetical protein